MIPFQVTKKVNQLMESLFINLYLWLRIYNIHTDIHKIYGYSGNKWSRAYVKEVNSYFVYHIRDDCLSPLSRSDPVNTAECNVDWRWGQHSVSYTHLDVYKRQHFY